MIQWLLDEGTEESQLLRLSMRKKYVNRLKKTNPATETYGEDSVVTEEMVEEFKTQQVRQLLTTAASVAIYEAAEGSITEVLRELFSKRRLKMKLITGGSYFRECSYFRSRKAKLGPGQIVPSPG